MGAKGFGHAEYFLKTIKGQVGQWQRSEGGEGEGGHGVESVVVGADGIWARIGGL